jgi:hypothetical protein
VAVGLGRVWLGLKSRAMGVWLRVRAREGVAIGLGRVWLGLRG